MARAGPSWDRPRVTPRPMPRSGSRRSTPREVNEPTAARMRDWEALFEAVDWIIAEQREFIAWWDNKVRAAQRPKKELSPSCDSFLSVAPG